MVDLHLEMIRKIAEGDTVIVAWCVVLSVLGLTF